MRITEGDPLYAMFQHLSTQGMLLGLYPSGEKEWMNSCKQLLHAMRDPVQRVVWAVYLSHAYSMGTDKPYGEVNLHMLADFEEEIAQMSMENICTSGASD